MKNEKRLDDLLQDRRCILVGEEIDGRLCEKLRTRLLRLSLESSDPIRVIIDSIGGSAYDGFHLADMLTAIPVRTVGIAAGNCHSVALAVLQGCTERVSLRHTHFLIHSATICYFLGPDKRQNDRNIRDVTRHRAEAQRSMERILLARSRLTRAELRKIIRAGDIDQVELSADRLLKLGLIDRISAAMFPSAEMA